MTDNKDRSYLRLIKSKSSIKESSRTHKTMHTIKKKESLLSRAKARLEWRGLTLREIILPVFTLGFLLGVCVYYIWGAVLYFQG